MSAIDLLLDKYLKTHPKEKLSVKKKEEEDSKVKE